MTMRKVIVLGCVLVAIAITLKVKLTTPQGPQPLARALFTTHLQQLRGDLALLLTTADRGEHRQAAGAIAQIAIASLVQPPVTRVTGKKVQTEVTFYSSGVQP
jgi:hypothetical protein